MISLVKRTINKTVLLVLAFSPAIAQHQPVERTAAVARNTPVAQYAAVVPNTPVAPDKLVAPNTRAVPDRLIAPSTPLASDTPIHLTAGDAIAAALSDNHTVRIASLDEQVAGSRYKEAASIFLPQATVSYSAMTTNNPLNAFGFRLQQKSIQPADFDPSRLNHPGATPDFMTSFDLQQPLINMDQLYQRRAANTQKEVYRLKSKWTRQEIIFETRKAYIQLQLAWRAEKVTGDALETARALYRYTQDRVDQGMLSKADALNVQVQIRSTESRLAEAKTQIRDASDQLGLLMGRSPGPIYSVDNATDSSALSDAFPAVGNTAAANTAATNAATTNAASLPEDRADLFALRKTIEASDQLIKSSKYSALPRLNAFASYQLNDSRMLGFGAGGYFAGIRLSWDLFKGNSIRNRTATLALEKNKLTEEYSQRKAQSIAEIDAARRKFGDAEFSILQQQAAVAGATESFRILKDRYEQGLSGSTDILLAQTQLSQQRLALAQAVFNRDLTNAWLDFLTISSAK